MHIDLRGCIRSYIYTSSTVTSALYDTSEPSQFPVQSLPVLRLPTSGDDFDEKSEFVARTRRCVHGCYICLYNYVCIVWTNRIICCRSPTGLVDLYTNIYVVHRDTPFIADLRVRHQDSSEFAIKPSSTTSKCLLHCVCVWVNHQSWYVGSSSFLSTSCHVERSELLDRTPRPIQARPLDFQLNELFEATVEARGVHWSTLSRLKSPFSHPTQLPFPNLCSISDQLQIERSLLRDVRDQDRYNRRNSVAVRVLAFVG